MIPEIIKSQFKELEKFGINTKLRRAHFLAQVAHESGGFKYTEEKLKYSDVNRIALIFKNDVDTNDDKMVSAAELEFVKQYVNNPQALANFVYANQNGNGDEASGDGWKFRGRGYIQLTGRSNYAAFSQSCGDDCVSFPDLVAGKYALTSAAWFFQKNNINSISDLGSSDAVVQRVTKKVNGGTHGLDDRIKLFKQYYAELA